MYKGAFHVSRFTLKVVTSRHRKNRRSTLSPGVLHGILRSRTTQPCSLLWPHHCISSLSSCTPLPAEDSKTTLKIPCPKPRAVIIVDCQKPQSRGRAALPAAFVAIG